MPICFEKILYTGFGRILYNPARRIVEPGLCSLALFAQGRRRRGCTDAKITILGDREGLQALTTTCAFLVDNCWRTTDLPCWLAGWGIVFSFTGREDGMEVLYLVAC